MREFLDTNVVLRYLTNDPIEMGERAATLIESDRELTISPMIIAECAFVLSRVYGRSRVDVVQALTDLLLRGNICVYGIETLVAVDALAKCSPTGAVGFPDALLWAEARSAGGVIHTFDEKFPRDGVSIMRP